MIRLTLLASLSCAVAISAPKPDSNLGGLKMPLVFEPNRGQAAAGVRFLARGSGYALLLRDDDAILRLPSSDLRMRLAGARHAKVIEALDPLPGTSSYFSGNDSSKWRTGIAQSGRVRYRDVYAGIDLVFKSAAGNRFEYDFVVAPGGDPGRIGVRFEGAQSTESDGDGGIILHTASGEIRQPRPRIYQELASGHKEIAGRMLVSKGNVIRFELGEYDRTRTLVIDPDVVQYLIGSVDDQFASIARDSAGNVYVAGFTASPEFIIKTIGTPGPKLAYHAFVTKFSPDLTTLYYSTLIAGTTTDTASGIQVDAAGNAYVVGSTRSRDFPTLHGAQMNFGNKHADTVSSAFIFKLDPTGANLVYSTYLGGEAYDLGIAIAIDGTGAAYTAGTATSPDFPFTPGAIHLGPKVVGDGGGSTIQTAVWVSKLSPDGGSWEYVSIFGGSEIAWATAIAADKDGSAYVAGYLQTIGLSDFPIVGNVVQPKRLGSFTCTSCSNGFISKLSPSGQSFVFSTYFGGSKTDTIQGITLDDAGTIYIVGNTSSSNLPVTAGVLGPTMLQSNNAYIAALNNSASAVVACSYLAGTTNGVASGVTIRSPGVIGIAGGAVSDYVGFPLSTNAIGGLYLELDPLFQKVISANTPGPYTAIYSAAAPAPDGSVALGASTHFLPTTSGTYVVSDRYGVFIAVTPATQAPPTNLPNIGSVVSASSFGGFSAVAPASFVEIYGTNLAPDTRGWTSADFTGNQAPTSLDGVEVDIAGQKAFVNFIVDTPGQVNVQLPSNIPTGAQQITVTNKNGTSAPFTVTVNATEPGLLAPASFQIGGKQYVVAFHADNVTYVLPAGAIAGLASKPAKPGETIVIYGNGFGPVSPDIPGGQLVTQANKLTLPLEVTIGDKPAQVPYAGLAPGLVGVYQFDVVVPAVSNNDLTSISFKLGGTPVPQTLYIAVHQ